MAKVSQTKALLPCPHTTADIREFTPTSWRSIVGIVPQVCLLHIITRDLGIDTDIGH